MSTCRTLVAAFIVSVLVAAAAPARAQFAVVDAGNIAQSVLTAANTAETVVNTYTQILRLKDQIANQLQTLKSLDPTSYRDLKDLLYSSKLSYDMIRNDVSAVGFSLKEVNRDFDTLYPRDKAKWRTIRHADYDTYYTRWNSEVTASSLSAARAQATITLVEKNNEAIQKILDRSNSDTSGEVRQLQLINQQLAVIHQDLGALVQNLSTLGRVTANLASAASGEKMLTREAKDRRRDGYTDLGRPPVRLRRLP